MTKLPTSGTLKRAGPTINKTQAGALVAQIGLVNGALLKR